MTDAHIEDVSARAFTIPTDAPESDGTLQWESTTLVLATVRSGETTGIGWTYGHAATAAVIGSDLAGVALTSVEHLEYFHDHVRVEEILFEGAPQSRGSELPANAERPRPRRRAA